MKLVGSPRPCSPNAVLSTAFRGVQPVDRPRAHASGPAPYRVLAVGGRLLVGYGVLTHDLAVTGALARALAGLVGHGFDVDSIISERSTIESVARSLQDVELARVDAVVLVLDQDGDPRHLVETARQLHRLAADLSARMVPGASITLVVPPSTMLRRSEEELAEFAATVREGAAASTRVVRLTERLDVSGAAERYRTWGETIAATVAESLAEPLLWSDAVDRLDEPKRQASVDSLGVLDTGWEAEFARIVAFAAAAYGASCASIGIIDGGRTRYLSRRGFDTVSEAREQTICDLAMRTHGGVIVGDAQADDRFSGFPLVRSGEVRFYAGYRVEGPDGQPVGVLCVFDDEPRPVLAQDLDLLRDFAQMAERRLWHLALTW